MRFAFTDDQLELRRAFRQVLEAECTVASLREAMGPPEGPPGPPSAERWQTLAGLGAQGLLAGEPLGLGLGDVEMVGVLEEAGWAALPEPLAETAAMVVPFLDGLPHRDSDAGVAGTLRSLAAGDGAGTVGGIRVTNEGWTSDTEVLGDGRARTPRVPNGAWGGLTAMLLGVPGERGIELHLLAATSGTDQARACPHEVERRPVASLDPTRQLADVQWRPSPQTRLDLDSAPDALAVLVDRATLAAAAQLLGLSARMIEMAAAYALERHQFGRPIGSFQAVKHHLADARVRLEFARPAVYRAAWTTSLGGDPATRAHDVSMAKALASDTAALTAEIALQVHGAIGYTWECDLQLWMKRAWALTRAWGDAPTHRARILRLLLERLDRAGRPDQLDQPGTSGPRRGEPTEQMDRR